MKYHLLSFTQPASRETPFSFNATQDFKTHSLCYTCVDTLHCLWKVFHCHSQHTSGYRINTVSDVMRCLGTIFLLNCLNIKPNVILDQRAVGVHLKVSHSVLSLYWIYSLNDLLLCSEEQSHKGLSQWWQIFPMQCIKPNISGKHAEAAIGWRWNPANTAVNGLAFCSISRVLGLYYERFDKLLSEHLLEWWVSHKTDWSVQSGYKCLVPFNTCPGFVYSKSNRPWKWLSEDRPVIKRHGLSGEFVFSSFQSCDRLGNRGGLWNILSR